MLEHGGPDPRRDGAGEDAVAEEGHAARSRLHHDPHHVPVLEAGPAGLGALDLYTVHQDLACGLSPDDGAVGVGLVERDARVGHAHVHVGGLARDQHFEVARP
eukprot:CAMPEP_0172168480 /NCGR_PEP_ID=MMETSP1050-20130122/10168_1 /TAXON_ID=233186 /ORGANISM="Cryptomonas curvata, Strain CCAP979/52" /LENGTH=102 /DNA_ID=CAMNT_0012839421 /DNA_START=2218 /DNA_END=2522 /DNA_ORIENTATION=+